MSKFHLFFFLKFKIFNDIIHPMYLINFFLYTTSFFFLFVTVFNDGCSSWYLAIPYLFFLIYQLKEYFIKGFDSVSAMSKMNLIMVMLFIAGINFPRESYSVFYPEVGKEMKINNSVIFTNSEYSPNSIKFINDDEDLNNHVDNKKYFKGDFIFKIEKKIVSNHPDFSTSYIYEVSTKNEEFTKIFLNNADGVPYTNMGYIPDWYSYDSIYINPSSIDDYDGIKIDHYNKENWFYLYNFYNFLPLYILIYFPILLLFIITLIFNKIKDKNKKTI